MVADIRGAGLRPRLELLPMHPAALALYRGSGWSEVLNLRPDWLLHAAGESGPDDVVMALLDGCGLDSPQP